MIEAAELMRGLECAPLEGFVAGSNMWPLVECVKLSPPVIGEIFDELLRTGFLSAELLPTPHLTDKSPNPEIVPDCEVTHLLTLTNEGSAFRRRLAKDASHDQR
jgi:hypothetical protein